MNKPMIEPLKKKTKEIEASFWSKFVVLLCITIFSVIVGYVAYRIQGDPYDNVREKAVNFCSVVDKESKVEMTDRTVDHLTYQVTCE